MPAYLFDRLLTEDEPTWYVPCLDFSGPGSRSAKDPREDLDLILIYGVRGASHLRAGEASCRFVTSINL